MKRVLITGATGFIGRHCLTYLLQEGFEIFAISSKKIPEDSKGIHWIQYDLLHSTAIQELLSQIKPTHLLHLAWNATPGQFWTSRDNIDWLKVSIDLVQAFADHGGKRAVIAGTCAEYDWNAAEFIESKTPCIPHTLYGSCKLALQIITEALAKQLGFSLAWGRIFQPFGPHDYPHRYVPSVIRALSQKESIPCSHGNQIRDYIFIEDVADAFVTLLDSQLQGIINIGSGSGVSLKQIAEILSERLDGKELLQFGAIATGAGEPPQLVANTSRLQNELQWSPKYSLTEGLNRTIDWWVKLGV